MWRRATNLFPEITIALVGIGAIEPSPLLARSGNIFSDDELESVASAGAVGDVCLRFFDRDGQPVANPLDERVIGLTLEGLRNVPRAIAVDGRPKHEAIREALTGHLISHLITDRHTAEHLLE